MGPLHELRFLGIHMPLEPLDEARQQLETVVQSKGSVLRGDVPGDDLKVPVVTMMIAKRLWALVHVLLQAVGQARTHIAESLPEKCPLIPFRDLQDIKLRADERMLQADPIDRAGEFQTP